MNNYDVIIVGGGPTGVAFGLELGMNNIKTLILEKHAAPLLSPRAQTLSARSMEFFMRWKIADVLNAKRLLPPDFPLQGVWCSKLNGKTYSVGGSNEKLNDNLSPQRAVRIPLWITEDVLRQRLTDFPHVTFLKQQEVINVAVANNEVQVTARDRQQQLTHYHASYVVACDGANSVTRENMGIAFERLSPAARVINLLFEAPDLEKNITVSKGFLYYLLENLQPGAVGIVDPQRGLWYAQIGYRGEEEDVAQVNIDQLLEEVTGLSFHKKIIQAHFWDMEVLIAKQFSHANRVFLVGDSAHGFAPTGGFGLNTGLGDVVNLAWKLSAVIQQRAKPDLLTTYEQERRPVCLHNLNAAKKNAENMMELRKKHDPAKDPISFAKANADVAATHSQSLGIMMGYAYFNSPLIQLLGNQSTATMPNHTYDPIANPGYFLPHIWLEKNRSIYTALSATNWTLLIAGEFHAETIEKWQQNMLKHQISVELLVVPAHSYPYRYTLIRPDWHIAMVGDELNTDYLGDHPFF